MIGYKQIIKKLVSIINHKEIRINKKNCRVYKLQVQVCTSTKRHFITCVVIVSIFFLFIDEVEVRGLNNSIYIDEMR